MIRSLKKYLSSKKALSLTELVVSSILVSVVMLGVVSFTYAIKQIQDSTSRSAILSAQTATAMSYIRKDAESAVGDLGGTELLNDANRTIGNGVREADGTICFRHDTLRTPYNYSDDTWDCYNLTGTDNTDTKLYRCANVPAAKVPYSGSCSGAGGSSTFLLNLTNRQTGYYKTNLDPLNSDSWESISFTLQTIYDPTKSSDPVTNPTYTLTATFNPISHSRKNH